MNLAQVVNTKAVIRTERNESEKNEKKKKTNQGGLFE